MFDAEKKKSKCYNKICQKSIINVENQTQFHMAEASKFVIEKEEYRKELVYCKAELEETKVKYRHSNEKNNAELDKSKDTVQKLVDKLEKLTKN